MARRLFTVQADLFRFDNWLILLRVGYGASQSRALSASPAMVTQWHEPDGLFFGGSKWISVAGWHARPIYGRAGTGCQAFDDERGSLPEPRGV